MGDVEDQNVERWKQLAATLRNRYPKP